MWLELFCWWLLESLVAIHYFQSYRGLDQVEIPVFRWIELIRILSNMGKFFSLNTQSTTNSSLFSFSTSIYGIYTFLLSSYLRNSADMMRFSRRQRFNQYQKYISAKKISRYIFHLFTILYTLNQVDIYLRWGMVSTLLIVIFLLFRPINRS